jgi:hypothetical protein
VSDAPASLDLREQIERIDRDIAESRKLRYVSDKLNEERNKLWHEARKSEAERDKLRGDSRLAPWLAVVTTVASIAALIASAISLGKSMGWLP